VQKQAHASETFILNNTFTGYIYFHYIEIFVKKNYKTGDSLAILKQHHNSYYQEIT
jgi:hypothetical protein